MTLIVPLKHLFLTSWTCYLQPAGVICTGCTQIRLSATCRALIAATTAHTPLAWPRTHCLGSSHSNGHAFHWCALHFQLSKQRRGHGTRWASSRAPTSHKLVHTQHPVRAEQHECVRQWKCETPNHLTAVSCSKARGDRARWCNGSARVSQLQHFTRAVLGTQCHTNGMSSSSTHTSQQVAGPYIAWAEDDEGQFAWHGRQAEQRDERRGFRAFRWQRLQWTQPICCKSPYYDTAIAGSRD